MPTTPTLTTNLPPETSEESLWSRGESVGEALSVSHDTGAIGGRGMVEVHVVSSGAASFDVEFSIDGTVWRKVDTLVLSGAGEKHQGYVNAYRRVRVSTVAVNDNSIEIVSSAQ